MGVGLVSLATLFPIGLLRLRDAARYSRSTYLAQSAAADLPVAVAALDARRSSITPCYNYGQLLRPLQPVYAGHALLLARLAGHGPTAGTPVPTPGSGGLSGYSVRLAVASRQIRSPSCSNPNVSHDQRARAPVRLRPALAVPDRQYTRRPASSGYLPVYGSTQAPSRPGSARGSASSANDPDNGRPSAHGLQRHHQLQSPVTRRRQSRPSFPASSSRREDVVWQEPTNQSYLIAGNRRDRCQRNGHSRSARRPAPCCPT